MKTANHFACLVFVLLASFAANKVCAEDSNIEIPAGLSVQRTVRVEKLSQLKGEPGVVIVLQNPGTFYVGGLYWVLWVGGKPYAEGLCEIPKLEKLEASNNTTRCFTLSAAAWEKLPDAAPLFLTWGKSEPKKGALPFAKLDKKKLEDAVKRP